MTPILSPVLTFITFTGLALRHNNALDISTAFTSLSLLVLLYKPFALVVGTLPLLASAAACFTRIQAYMNKPSWEDHRTHDLESTSSKGTQVCSASPSARNQIELLELKKQEPNVSAWVNAKFRRNTNAEIVLDITDWKIKRHTFTLLLGPVGCGKSTALKGLLGELSDFEGSIKVVSHGVAFCDQVPWLPNGSFRDIVLGDTDFGETDFDEMWYKSVISACALDEDIEQWPQGDQSIIGSKGTTLSGGQKQRTVSIRIVGLRFMYTDG